MERFLSSKSKGQKCYSNQKGRNVILACKHAYVIIKVNKNAQNNEKTMIKTINYYILLHINTIVHSL